MGDLATVTDADLARARQDSAFRQQLLANSLNTLLAKLNKVRMSQDAADSVQASQLRDGIELAVKLADLLHVRLKMAGPMPPRRSAVVLPFTPRRV